MDCIVKEHEKQRSSSELSVLEKPWASYYDHDVLSETSFKAALNTRKGSYASNSLPNSTSSNRTFFPHGAPQPPMVYQLLESAQIAFTSIQLPTQVNSLASHILHLTTI